MEKFLKQIKDDILVYQEEYKCMENINKEEWAFNFWVLDRLFYVETDVIENYIIDYNDRGIDCYVFYEDSKELYLIQNKFYNDESTLSKSYVTDDFLVKPKNYLEGGNYSRSSELQNIYKKYKGNEEFSVHLELYVTNNNRTEQIDECIKSFNKTNDKFSAEIYYLDDIQEKYFGEIKENRINLTVDIESINKGTILNVNSQDYKLKNNLDARYVFTPVTSIYKIYREAKEKNYPIFDKNIREYLGSTGINKNIIKTLKDESDRINFFYYNNGITLICEKMSSLSNNNGMFNRSTKFTIDNPQIINGCQTVNSIYEVLFNEEPETLEDNFKDTFVMLKVLVINDSDGGQNKLYKDIVKYNNSQNSIDEKTFTSNNNLFIRYQTELERRGFLLLIKQSDKNIFKTKYKKYTPLRSLNDEYFERFSLDNKRLDKCYIRLEKLLQVIIAFVSGGHSAFNKKQSLLKFNSDVYNMVVKFLEENISYEALIDLWMLYLRAENEKKISDDKRSPIPYYLIDFFSLYDCENRKMEEIHKNLVNKEQIDIVIKLHQRVSKWYAKYNLDEKNLDYNTMIKKAIDYERVNKFIEQAKD